MYAIARLEKTWEMSPIAGVRTAPPTIPMMMKDPPIFVFGPNPFTPSAKIVGNMTDMKKLVSSIAHTPSHPGKSTPRVTSTMFTRA